MKIPFKRDVAAALAKARAGLAAAEAKIAELERARPAALVASDDDVDGVRAIERSMAEQRGTAAVYRDRIAVLEIEARQQDRQQREKDKAAEIAGHEKLLARRHAAVVEVQTNLAAFCDSLKNYIEIHRATDLKFSVDLWPAYAPVTLVSISVIDRLAEVLSLRRAHAETLLIEAAARFGDLSTEIAAANTASIAALRDLPLPDDVSARAAA